jgi:hypothetical protein
MGKAQQADAIVSSIFPSAVRTKLYEGNESYSNAKGNGPFQSFVPGVVSSQKVRIKSFLDEWPEGTHEEETQLKAASLEKAIADIFPDVTIMFADIVGLVVGAVSASHVNTRRRNSVDGGFTGEGHC